MRTEQTKTVYINSCGHFHPSHEIPSGKFEQLGCGHEESWIVGRTGIEFRRSILTWPQIEQIVQGETSGRALQAKGDVMSAAQITMPALEHAKTRLGQANWQPDLLLCGTSIPDFDIPATAATIANEAGIRCPVFDINSACSSFLTGLQTSASLISCGNYDRIALCIPERYTLRLDYTDVKSAPLFGDGAAVALLSNQPGRRSFELIDTVLDSNPSGHADVVIPPEGLFRQNGPAVQKFAIQKTCEITGRILEQNDLEIADIDYFISHQANLRMLKSVCSRLKVPEHRHLHNCARFGNQGAAGAPAVLSANWDAIESGSLVLMAVVGSGLTWGAALLKRL